MSNTHFHQIDEQRGEHPSSKEGTSMIERRPLGEKGQCEAYDWIPTDDDAIYTRCQHDGRVIRERGEGMDRHRCVCPIHGLTSAMETN